MTKVSSEDQKLHMESLVKQAKDLNDEVANLQGQMAAKRDLLLRVQGAIEYLQQVGVPLPTEETKPEIEESETAEEE